MLSELPAADNPFPQYRVYQYHNAAITFIPAGTVLNTPRWEDAERGRLVAGDD
jgi:hypothetical protein